MPSILALLCLLLTTLLGAPTTEVAPTVGAPHPQAETRAVKGGRVTPQWMPDGESFWYATGGIKERVILVVRPDGAPATPLFDVERLRALLAAATEKDVKHAGLPFSKFDFRDDGASVRFAYKGSRWDLRLADYELTEVPAEEAKRDQLRAPRKLEDPFTTGGDPVMERRSPDGELFLRAKDDNLSLRRLTDEETTPLTEDGEKYWSWAADEGCWSPDGRHLAVFRVDAREVPRVAVVDWLQESEEVEFHPFPRAGQAMPLMAVHVFDVASGEQLAVEGTGRPDEYVMVWGWRADGSEVLIFRLQREFEKLELLAADPATGKSRVVLTETSDTFIGALELMQMWRSLFTEVGDGERFVWMSDKSGWRHLYLCDFAGNELGPITSGEFPVENVEAVDAATETIWFRGHAEEDPYETQLYRCRLDGEGFAKLTVGPGTHEVSFGPAKRTFVDVFSSPQVPPCTEYRRADGTLLSTVAKADLAELKGDDWRAPESFIVPAADGVTELHGLLVKPQDFDPQRKYPILDYIYNGPFTTWVPHVFNDGRTSAAEMFAAKGFLVMIVDGRGTIGRSKAFQDVVYLKFGTNEIPDHVSALHALAAARPYIDLDRVGIMGGSWGGYMTVRAMLTAPDVYHAGAASAPVYDLYDHHALPIEGYMGTPQHNPEAYDAASSLKLVGKLEGALMLIHGTADVNATFSATMKMVSALVKANKPHDLIVLPGADHSMQVGASYMFGRQMAFFEEHLMPDLDVPVD